jgi:hypothetical protein
MTEQNNATDQEFLFVALGEIVNRIERCGASPELTNSVSLASDLRQAIGNQWNPANTYALERVKAELVHNDEYQNGVQAAAGGLTQVAVE